MVACACRSWRRLLPALLLAPLLLTGCGGFQRAWQQVPINLPEDTIAGQWQGTWTSETSGHQAPLRCVVTPIDEKQVEAYFEAKYARVLTDRFHVRLTADRRSGAVWHVSGKQDLGWLKGGVFTCEGSIDPRKFFARYQSKDDQGYFELTRPGAAEETSGYRRSPWATQDTRILLAAEHAAREHLPVAGQPR